MEARENRGMRRGKGNGTLIKIEKDVELLSLVDDLKRRGALHKDKFIQILDQASSVLENEPTVLKIPAPVVIVGDIHGQFYDLLKIFQRVGPVPQQTYLFLGDYVDRGKFCIEVLTLLLRLKTNYPSNIFLLRGNHEGRTMTTFFNFKLQCQKKYNSQVYERVLDLFKRLPLCAIVNNKYFAVHGGISPRLNHLYEIERINRFVEISDGQPMSDLLWSDPSDSCSDQFQHNRLRCCSYIYSPIQSEAFLRANELSLIIRGHEVDSKGYKYQLSPKNLPLTLTVFSAPNYCDTYHNQATIALLKSNEIELKTFKETAHPLVLDNYMDVFEFTLPLFTTNITQIFKHILKASQKASKKRSSHDRKEEIETIRCVEALETHFEAHSSELFKFVVGHLEPKEDPLEEARNGEFSEEMLMRFLALKASDEAQKLPKSFGPKNLEFKKINISMRDESELEVEEEEKCNEWAYI